MKKKGFVLITGVSTGIGYNATKYLIDQGYSVLGSVRKRTDADRISAELGQNYYPLIFDVTNPDQLRKAKEEVDEILGDNKLKALVNNAGIAKGGPIELLSDEDFRWQMEVNLFAVRNVTNTFLPLLKGNRDQKVQGGKIIMISSISGYFNSPYNGAYCISKHAVESLAEIYRRELYMYNIDVVSLQPGPIASEIWKKNIDVCKDYEDSDYQVLCRRADKVLRKSKDSALDPIVVSKLIARSIERKSKLSYVINRNLFGTIVFTKWIPRRWMDKILYKQFFKERG